MSINCLFLWLWAAALCALCAAAAIGERPLRVDAETGHTHQEWEKYCLVTQYSVASVFSEDSSTSSSAAFSARHASSAPSASGLSVLLAAASSRVFAPGHAKSAGRLRSYISFTQEDFLTSPSSFAHIRQYHHSLQLPVFFRENANALKTTFLETFTDRDQYAEEGFEYLLYVSPSSVLLNSNLLESVFDSKEERGVEKDVIHCNSLPYSLKLIIELFPYNVHSLGLRPETLQALLTEGGTGNEGMFCGVDVFVLPLHLLGRVQRRIESIMAAALMQQVESQQLEQEDTHALSLSLQQHKDYFFSVVLLNMALLEEGVHMEVLPVLNTEEPSILPSSSPSSPSTPPSSPPSSGVMIFPPPLIFQHLDDVFSVSSDLVQEGEEGEEGFVGLHFNVPSSGAAEECATTLHGLVGAERLQERWSTTLNTNIFCLLAGQFFTAVAPKAYLEVNSHEAWLRAGASAGLRLWLTGRSFVLSPPAPSSCHHFFASPQMQGRTSSLFPLLNSLECVDQQEGEGGTESLLPAISTLLTAPLPLYIHLHGCLTDVDTALTENERGLFRLEQGAAGGGAQCGSSAEVGGKEDALEALYLSLLAVPTEALPCLVAVTPALAHPRQRARFARVMQSLGLVQVHEEEGGDQGTASAAIGPHCSKHDFLAVSTLLPPAMAPLLAPLISFSSMQYEEEKREEEEGSGRKEWRGRGVPEPYFTFPGGGAGISMLRDSSRIATSVENCLPPDIFRLLYGRLKHRGYVALGANSHFVPFDGSRGRSVVERVILQYLAPLVVGHQDEARKLGFVGAEWWIQHRETSAPKEYHYDSALTWCRDNGWSADELQHCPFYPQIGSIFYLTAAGGPTAVFDEHTHNHNPEPPIPEDVAIIFPQKNRMGLFKGNRYHGVLHDPRIEEFPEQTTDTNHASPPAPPEMRLTLLINYWRLRDVGENFTHILPQERAFLRRFEEIQHDQSYRHEETLDREDASDYEAGSTLPAHSFANEDSDPALFLFPPHEVGFQEVSVEADILDYLEHFQSQRLAPDLFRSILLEHQSQNQSATTSLRTPVTLLSFPRNSTYSAYCRDLIRTQNMTLARYTTYTRDPASGKARVSQLGTLQSHAEWRGGWPHQPEDHEQQVRDMFN